MRRDSTRWVRSSADAWQEWNGKFRDDVRSFVKSDNGRVAALANASPAAPTFTARMCANRKQSVNFVTVHDGFTLNDLVSYSDKHTRPTVKKTRWRQRQLQLELRRRRPTDDRRWKRCATAR